ncbi:hypothetical protein OEA41_007720 [Lepraria neglecta]|uniref:Uncharacterized protein n=1 Tax=Lepraria neglecta TaxID=209136 RepID=A0AAE0DNI1_9LECA|nr:hypothetical protein OEA41_007720 [Lepraria neglecta]
MPNKAYQNNAAGDRSSAGNRAPATGQASAGTQNYVQNADRYNAHLWSQQQSGLSREQSRRQYLKAWTDDGNNKSL